MAKVTNNSKVVRGVVLKEGQNTRTVHLKPGASVDGEFAADYLEKLGDRGFFKVEGAKKAPASKPND